MRCHGVVINTAVGMGCAEGTVSHHDSNLLAENGGHISISKITPTPHGLLLQKYHQKIVMHLRHSSFTMLMYCWIMGIFLMLL